MKKLRALVLMHETLVPPSSLDGYSESEILEWKTEFDVVNTLRELGHEVLPLGVYDDLGDLRRAKEDFKPHIVFNLLEEFHGVGVYDHHVVSYLELLKQPYTGCNPRGLLLARDKPLAKKILSWHRISTPGFFVVSRSKKTRRPAGFEYPLLVKSASEDASMGITERSVVRDDDELEQRVLKIHEETQTDALVETFIEGRELYVGLIGNRRVKTLPIWEMHFHNAKPESTKIATSRVKWDPEYQKKLGIETTEASDLPKSVKDEIQKICKRTYKALSLSGYARMDLRLKENGDVYVIEANPNPNLSFGEDLAESAEIVGINYEQLLTKIISLGLNYQAEWRLV
ncbi:D-alanine--D-alanine ligase family protein [Mariniblastus fucicola]|uniref:D-alanine--D-alanine ligase n=1 Tax=Mariniblastus fucicola TaxID=980251 RepID=A0A5B9P7G1_9BACT|nr:ATP-grasp domain-containing protein [Mariniblastus fucicola]QEG21135.1 D-alanine--D-alanine ligase [Mariniblastus fucicola]